jgi:hypothetical protein
LLIAPSLSSFFDNSNTQRSSEELKAEVEVNELKIDQAFMLKQMEPTAEGAVDLTEVMHLRKQLDSLQHENLLKRQRLQMLTGTATELNSKQLEKLAPVSGGKASKLIELAIEVEEKVRTEEVLKDQLEFNHTRMSHTISKLKVRYSEIEDKFKRVNRHFVKTQHTEFVALNCVAAATMQRTLFIDAMAESRGNYAKLKGSQIDRRAQTRLEAQRSLDRMSASTLAGKVKISHRRSMSSVIETVVASHETNAAQLKASQTKLQYFINLFTQVQQPLVKYGLSLSLNTGIEPLQVAELISIFKNTVSKELFLKMRFQELSNDAIEKRTECDSIQQDLDLLKADQLLGQTRRTTSLSLNLLSAHVKEAEADTARQEYVAGLEDVVMRVFCKLQESMRTSLACILIVETFLPIKHKLKQVCNQLQEVLNSKPISASLPTRRSPKRYIRSRSMNSSRASTTHTFATEASSEEPRFFTHRSDMNGASSPRKAISLARGGAADDSLGKYAQELEKSNFIRYFGQTDNELTCSEDTFENPVLVLIHIIQEASHKVRKTFAVLSDRGRSLVALLASQNMSLRKHIVNSIEKLPDKSHKVKEDLESIKDDYVLYTFNRKSPFVKQPSQSFQPRRMTKSVDNSFDEVEEMPRILTDLRAYKSKLKGRLNKQPAKKLRSAKAASAERIYLVPKHSELRSVIQEVNYYDSSIKRLYSTEKMAKIKLPLQVQPLLSKKIRIVDSALQQTMMRSLANLPKLRSPRG